MDGLIPPMIVERTIDFSNYPLDGVGTALAMCSIEHQSEDKELERKRMRMSRGGRDNRRATGDTKHPHADQALQGTPNPSFPLSYQVIPTLNLVSGMVKDTKTTSPTTIFYQIYRSNLGDWEEERRAKV